MNYKFENGKERRKTIWKVIPLQPLSNRFLHFSLKTEFILESSLMGISDILGKKCSLKFMLLHQMGYKKDRPKGKYYFF